MTRRRNDVTDHNKLRASEKLRQATAAVTTNHASASLSDCHMERLGCYLGGKGNGAETGCVSLDGNLYKKWNASPTIPSEHLEHVLAAKGSLLSTSFSWGFTTSQAEPCEGPQNLHTEATLYGPFVPMNMVREDKLSWITRL